MPRLDRRIDALEDIYVPPRERFVIRIVPMTRPGRVFVPSAYSLPGGRTITRGATETQDSFEARVTAEALASTSGLPMIFCVDGAEVSAA
jgi:hypothetical protein